jgi:hypothetical protein
VAQEISDISEAIGVGKNFMAEVEKEPAEIEVENSVDQIKKIEKADGRLILAEDIEKGHVSWKAVNLFLKAIGGNFPFLFMMTWVGGLFLYEGCTMFSVWFLGYWVNQYQHHDPSEVSAAQ